MTRSVAPGAVPAGYRPVVSVSRIQTGRGESVDGKAGDVEGDESGGGASADTAVADVRHGADKRIGAGRGKGQR